MYAPEIGANSVSGTIKHLSGDISADQRTQVPLIKERTVAAHCDVCGKKPSFGNSISHSHRRTSRRWNPNIQTVRTVTNGTPKKVNVCTSCLKAGKVAR